MAENATLELDHDEMSLTDFNLVSLYLQYPDMQRADDAFLDGCSEDPSSVALTASSPESSPPSAHLSSSPLPNVTRYESPASSPLSPPDIIPFPALTILPNEQEVDELSTRFDATLNSYDIPQHTAEFLAEMKSVIATMGTLLFFGGQDLTSDLERFRRVISAGNWLMMSLRQAQDIFQEEIDAIEAILELAPFTVRPAPKDLWVNYRQMAALIIQRTTIPSSRVYDLCDQLCHLYDACVYRPMLELSQIRRQDEAIDDLLDHVYNAIMMLPARYKQWMMAMRWVGDGFTKPTMRKILQSPDVMMNILESEGRHEQATQSVPEMEAATRQVFTTVNIKHRRKQQHLMRHGRFALRRGQASVF